MRLPAAAWMHRMVDLAPLAAVLLFLAAILSTVWYLGMEEKRREQEALQRDVEYSQQRLRLRLTERQEQLMRLARDIGNHELTADSFPARAEHMLIQHPALLGIHWIDAHGRLLESALSPTGRMRGKALAAGQPLPAGDVLQGYELARNLRQPVFSLSDGKSAALPALPALYLHVPIAPKGLFEGEVLAEFSVDALLHYDVPAEILAKYAVALLDESGRLLAGQSIPARPHPARALPWKEKVNEADSPVDPSGSGLVLRAQAWRTSPTLVGNAMFWLVAVLAGLTVWMLLVSWRQSRHRQRAQQALQAETSFRRAMENSMRTGMRALDMQGRITYVNAAFCQMTGWSEQDLLNHAPPFPYWHEEDHGILGRRLASELQGQADPGGIQMRVRRKDGSAFDARLYVSPLIDASGRQSGWIGSMTDITEPNRVRQQLSAAHDRFTTVLEALDASVSVAPLGSQELLFANNLYRQWFGDTTAGHLTLLVRGGSLADAPASAPAPAAPAAPPAASRTGAAQASVDADVDAYAGLPMDKLVSTPPSEHAEVYIERLGKWLEVRSRYLGWMDGRLAQMVIATDITARRQAQQQAEEQAMRTQTVSRLITMGEMASSVAHELNQPLTAISNYCTGMIARLHSGNISQQDLLGALDKTARQAQRAGQVVQHIRSFVKRSEPRRQRAEVMPMVEQVIELAGIELRRRQVQLTHHVAPGLPALYADPILIEQVLLNLIKNGAEAISAAARAPGQRQVDLHVQATDGPPAAIRFRVTDTGPGIPPEVLARMYEAFFSTKQQGLGIGLNLCRSIIEAHQGRIETTNLYNSGLCVGCRITFWIPLGPLPDMPGPGRKEAA